MFRLNDGGGYDFVRGATGNEEDFHEDMRYTPTQRQKLTDDVHEQQKVLAQLKKQEVAAESRVRLYTPDQTPGWCARAARLISKILAPLETKATAETKLEGIQKKLEEANVLLGQIPAGVRSGVRVLELQEQLANKKLGSQERKEIYGEIVEIFTKATYAESNLLRKTVNGTGTGTSRLHKLIFDDVDVATSHKIIRAINKSALAAYKENPNSVKFSYKVFSDIDDTINGSLNDRGTKVHGFYPGVMAFYSELAKLGEKEGGEKEGAVKESEIALTLLSARPKVYQDRWNKGLTRKLPKGTKFHSLYGSTPAIIEGIKHYAQKIFALLAIPLVSVKYGKTIRQWCKKRESQAVTSFAIEKRTNIDRELMIWPEMRGIMVGDCGEGDAMTMIDKMNGQRASQTDVRIPEEYRGTEKWEGDPNSPGNPANRPLFLSFAHAISSASDADYGLNNARPSPANREEFFRDNKTYMFDNYVDTALHCLEKGFFDRDAADVVVRDCEQWLKKEEKTINEMFSNHDITKRSDLDSWEDNEIAGLLPNVQYRFKLIRSISKYESYVNSLSRPKQPLFAGDL